MTETATVIEEEKISTYSAALGQKANHLQTQLQTVREEEKIIQEKLSSLSEDLETLIEKYQPSIEKGKLFAIQAQCGNLSLSDWIVFQAAYAENRQELEPLEAEIADLSEQYSALEERDECISKELAEIDAAQNILQQRWSGEDLLLEGEPAESAYLQGTAMLPNTGGIKSSKTLDFSCLAYLDGNELYSSTGFLWPVENSSVSAGTWSYPSGGMHLGLDLAAQMYSEVYAPAAGIILYADAPVSSSCGYLGNYCGYPRGGGNTICMLCLTDEKLYAVTFAHLSSTLFASAGQQVEQGSVIALSGNSGNSSGPHTHIEVFEILVSFQEAVAYFSSAADFSWGCGFSTPASSSRYAVRIRPESVFY